MGIKGPWRQQDAVITGSKNLRDERLIDQRALRTAVLKERIPVATQGHHRVNTWLHSPRHWQHDAPVMWSSLTSTSIQVTSCVPAQGSLPYYM